MSETMVSVFTCRLCGRTFSVATFGIPAGNGERYRYLADSIQGNSPMAVHDCRENTFGIADVVGIKPKDSK